MKSKHSSTRKASVSAILARLLQRGLGVVSVAAPPASKPWNTSPRRSTIALETLEPRPAGVPDLAHQYLGDADTRGIDPSFDLYGGGGLAATTSDMARFTRALFAGGVFAKPTSITLMTTIPDIADAARTYAFGMSRQKYAGDTYWGHSGFWNTLAAHVPVRDVTVALSVTQQQRSNVGRALLRAVLERVRP